MVRVLVACYPDWPVVAAGCHPTVAVAVVHANRVVAATTAARAGGVRTGQRRREAQSRCPEVEVIAADAGRDARAWERVVAVVESLTPAVEVTAPGALCLATRGPSRLFGGDKSLAARVVAEVEAEVGEAGCQVGVADGRFAAALAARAATGDGVLVVARGGSRAWLSPQPVGVLGPELEGLADLLVRLGIRTLGDLGRLPARAVLGRFGPDGVTAHRLARGLDDRPPAARVPPPQLAVTAELDPPAERVDTAAFVAKTLAGELHLRLGKLGLACTAVTIEAETEHGESVTRRWRHEGALSVADLAERARWQLDGWLAESRPTAGVSMLRLTPEEVRPDHGHQLGFWGGSAQADARVARALARVQGMLGPESVVTAVLAGGRGPADQVRLVPWGDRAPTVETSPWPGHLTSPSPAVVHQAPLRAEVCDGAGAAVTVSGRGMLSAVPAVVSVAGGPWEAVERWAGPWPVEERWWDSGGRRRAWLQVLLKGGAHLLTREAGGWWIEATYD